MLRVLDELLIDTHRNHHPLHGREQLRVLGVHEYLERGKRTALGCVDDGDSWAIPASWVLGSTLPVKGSGRECLLADTPGRDQAKIPCSMRPKTRSTSLDPGSVAASCNGVCPRSSRSGRCSHWRALSSLSRAETASEMILMRRARRSDSSGLRRAPLFSRRSRVFSLILTIEPTFVGRMPRNAPMRFTTEGGRPPRTTAAISRSFSSGYDLKTTDICLQNIDNCLEGQGHLVRASVVGALGTHRVRSGDCSIYRRPNAEQRAARRRG